MYIRRTQRTHKGKTYVNHLLVESVQTPKGPRQRTICSLGSLEPGPPEQWRILAHKLEAALQGQYALGENRETRPPPQPLARRGRRPRGKAGSGPLLTIDVSQVTTEEHREAGPAHVGHQLWRQLGVEEILREAGFSQRASVLTEVMTLNRLVFPLSEYAMPDWIRRTALGDILGEDFTGLNEDALYRHLDRLHPNRERIESALAERERTLFNLDETFFLYDLTSTYFEGQAAANPQAQRGYSRDRRPDCKQVVVGLVLDRDGFPKAHEIFAGNRQDRSTVEAMLDSLEQRTGKKPGSTVVVDRGMAFEENLCQIRARGYHYIVAGRQTERHAWWADFEDEAGWEEVRRQPSPRNPFQHKSRVQIKRRSQGQEVFILCRSDGREEKDRAIRDKQEERFLADLERLRQRVVGGRLQQPEKIHQALGRLKERYPRVARYYRLDYETASRQLIWQEEVEKKVLAVRLDGSYLLKTDRQDMTADEVWRTYILLTRVESAFRSLKSPLMERPIFHQLQNRTQTHIFLCVLAYHLLVAIEKRFLDQGIHTSWWTLRQALSSHQVATIVLPMKKDLVLKVRKGSTPEPQHREIYQVLQIPVEVMQPIKTWHRNSEM